jgi:hypothetical protein
MTNVLTAWYQRNPRNSRDYTPTHEIWKTERNSLIYCEITKVWVLPTSWAPIEHFDDSFWTDFHIWFWTSIQPLDSLFCSGTTRIFLRPQKHSGDL